MENKADSENPGRVSRRAAALATMEKQHRLRIALRAALVPVGSVVTLDQLCERFPGHGRGDIAIELRRLEKRGVVKFLPDWKFELRDD